VKNSEENEFIIKERLRLKMVLAVGIINIAFYFLILKKKIFIINFSLYKKKKKNIIKNYIKFYPIN
jgi:hypothetical protein